MSESSAFAVELRRVREGRGGSVSRSDGSGAACSLVFLEPRAQHVGRGGRGRGRGGRRSAAGRARPGAAHAHEAPRLHQEDGSLQQSVSTTATYPSATNGDKLVNGPHMGL